MVSEDVRKIIETLTNQKTVLCSILIYNLLVAYSCSGYLIQINNQDIHSTILLRCILQ